QAANHVGWEGRGSLFRARIQACEPQALLDDRPGQPAIKRLRQKPWVTIEGDEARVDLCVGRHVSSPATPAQRPCPLLEFPQHYAPPPALDPPIAWRPSNSAPFRALTPRAPIAATVPCRHAREARARP